MLPPAPGRSSITNGCPTICDAWSSTTRVTVSEALPAGYGLMTRIGRVGHCCALAGRAAANAPTHAAPARKLRREISEGANESAMAVQCSSQLVRTHYAFRPRRNNVRSLTLMTAFDCVCLWVSAGRGSAAVWLGAPSPLFWITAFRIGSMGARVPDRKNYISAQCPDCGSEAQLLSALGGPT